MEIDQYYPFSVCHEKSLENDNYILSCRRCNIIKGNKMPIDCEGNIIILHPYLDDYSLHMHVDDSGMLIADSPEGKSTIDIMDLNRDALVKYRNSNPFLFTMEYDRDESSYGLFKTSIEYIEQLLRVANGVPVEDVQQYFYRMLYANVISAMEAYLSKIIMVLLQNNENLKWNFVEHFDWNQESFYINNIKREYDNIDLRIQENLNNILYHNIPKVKAIFDKTLRIRILQDTSDMKQICEAVAVRHDIVHRNGRKSQKKYDKITDEYHTIKEKSIKDLIKLVNKIVNDIEDQINKNGFLIMKE